MSKDTVQIGLISDTHGLLRPEARVALAGVDRIIHAGDICNAQVLEELARIAPVVAVRGNNDKGSWAETLNEAETVQVAGIRIHVLHDLKEFAAQPQESGIQVVVSGHSHRPAISRENDVLFINPGSAGPRRFRLPISLGFLEIKDGSVRARLQTLEVD